jgi:branched-subunit amino acid aminotransferase/4-amino-4-deoxychorismate lyase
VFETIRLKAGKPYQWKAHYARLTAGMAALRLPPPQMDITTIARDLITRTRAQDGMLRLSVSRASGGAGYLPEPAPSTLVMEMFPPRPVPSHPLRLITSRYRRPRDTGLGDGLKTMQGVLSTLARMEARDDEADDALLLDTSGHLSEASGSNLFWRKGDALFTPALSCGISAGTMRAAVLRLSPWPVQEVEALPDTLKDADEVFLTSVSYLAHAVSSLDSLHWRKHEAATRFRVLIEEDHASLGWH